MQTMAIVHCGFVPHPNKITNQRLISQRNNPVDDTITKSSRDRYKQSRNQ